VSDEVSLRRRYAGLAVVLTALALPGVARARSDCRPPEHGRTLEVTRYVRVYEVRHPDSADERSDLVGCLRSNGKRRLLTTAFYDGGEDAGFYDQRSFELIDVGGTYVAYHVDASDSEGGNLYDDEVVDLRDGKVPGGRGARTERAIALDEHRIAWTTQKFFPDGGERRFVFGAGPHGARVLARGRTIRLDYLRDRGRRVYWKEGGRTRSARVP
jgi:hypothetical protein